MIKVVFFAQTRELIGEAELSVPAQYADVEALRQDLSQRGERWALALNSGRILAAVNQDLVPLNTALKAGDEVAFFPPVTGG
ncbi:molybdopterin synthase small subunit [Gallibacterium salpingitidis]|uniref:Molybdopterin synthase sulfur carrier subunit n=1 Tax=Gallibacterium salpingitidis TaxID=505341 RepID=A0A1A7QAP7_9PAST|nr:molybdopterin synthase sulfur carrier subunit [Gallibacterium salpingitidis]OBW92141.1 molybdopterin synthase small subunit [Gallibacterium salpingitidis]OBX08034.1 molybdopterin synthase small subunit [Gallibacterium salpingitidis]OBX11264.1 molybdopterin synthase small subunit [Gallibacterium salpingitidis]WKT00666.1 molybdopterin synthase sulfur carrier subunit [Gallibacterium salpingitidis]